MTDVFIEVPSVATKQHPRGFLRRLQRIPCTLVGDVFQFTGRQVPCKIRKSILIFPFISVCVSCKSASSPEVSIFPALMQAQAEGALPTLQHSMKRESLLL